MKSLKLSEVPVEYALLALNNVKAQASDDVLKKLYKKDAQLAGAFDWKRSKEGFDFWDTVNESYGVESPENEEINSFILQLARMLSQTN